MAYVCLVAHGIFTIYAIFKIFVTIQYFTFFATILFLTIVYRLLLLFNDLEHIFLHIICFKGGY